jgi:tetratricopeptide (TPR) repeat protein
MQWKTKFYNIVRGSPVANSSVRDAPVSRLPETNQVGGGAISESPLPVQPSSEGFEILNYLTFLRRRLEEAELKGNQTQCREYYELLAAVYETARDWRFATSFLEKLSALYFKQTEFVLFAITARRLAYSLRQQKRLPEALEALERGWRDGFLKLLNGSDLKLEAQLLEQFAIVYLELGWPDKALSYLTEALPIRMKLKAPLGIASSKSLMGLAYSELGNHAKALKFICDGLQARLELNARTEVGRSLKSLASAHRKEKNLPRAAFVYHLNLQWEIRHGGDSAKAVAHLELARVLKDLYAAESSKVSAEHYTVNSLQFSDAESALLRKAEGRCPEREPWNLAPSNLFSLALSNYQECLELAEGLDTSVLKQAKNEMRDLEQQKDLADSTRNL